MQKEVFWMTEVVAALVWQEGKLLICQRPAHKARGLLWEFPGGKVEVGETKEAALVRECQEELAVTVAVEKMFVEVTHAYPDLTVHLTLFLAHIDAGTIEKREHHDIRFVEVEELSQYPFCPADVDILAQIQMQFGTKGEAM